MAKGKVKHFIDLELHSTKELQDIIKLAIKLKKQNITAQKNLLTGKNLAMIFEKNSTRTRVSFEVGINQLGGSAIVMNKNDMQLGKGETVIDTAKVLSRFVDGVMIRSDAHETIVELSHNSSVPVINGLSDFSHPCQIMASLMTIQEHIGLVKGKKLTWLGDHNNVLNSYIQAAAIFGYELAIGAPEELTFCDLEVKKARRKGAIISCTTDAAKAAKDADVVITDTWFSMGDESERNDAFKQKKINLLKEYQVNSKIMKLAKKGAIFTHCLPAYRGFEVTAEVIDSNKSVVFDEAENRLHVQKAIMLWLMS
jgi:ornithine carbamoyltransferase